MKSAEVALLTLGTSAGLACGLLVGYWKFLKPRLPKETVKQFLLVNFRADAPEEKVRDFIDTYRELPSKLDSMRGFEWGEDVTPSPEALHKGYTHIFVVTFPDTASRNAYLPDDKHILVADKLKEVSDDFLAVVINPKVEKSAYYQQNDRQYI